MISRDERLKDILDRHRKANNDIIAYKEICVLCKEIHRAEYNKALDDVMKILKSTVSWIESMNKIESLRKPESEEKNPTATQLILRHLTGAECRGNEDIEDMVRTELEFFEYDGLYCEDCGCSLDDFMPCTEFCPDKCRAGYKGLTEDPIDGKTIWGIGPEKLEFSEEELAEHPSLRAIESSLKVEGEEESGEI